jgi:hypothetical protein
VSTASIRLRRRLFFLPSPLPRPPLPGTTATVARTFNPFIKSASPCLFPARYAPLYTILPAFLCPSSTLVAQRLSPFRMAKLLLTGDVRPAILDARFGGARGRRCRA